MKVPRKMIFNHFFIFGLVKCHFGLLGLKNSPLSGHLPKNRKYFKNTSGHGERGEMITLNWVHLCVNGFKISI